MKRKHLTDRSRKRVNFEDGGTTYGSKFNPIEAALDTIPWEDHDDEWPEEWLLDGDWDLVLEAIK